MDKVEDEDRAAEQTRVETCPNGLLSLRSRQQEERSTGRPNFQLAAWLGWTRDNRTGCRGCCRHFYWLGLDKWLGTTPTLMVVFFFIGSAAGMMNVWRALTGRGMAAGFVDEKSLKAGENKADEQMNRRD